MDTITTGKKSRVSSTIFKNGSGVEVTSGIQRFMGELKGFRFVLESIVNNENPEATIKSVTRIEIDIRGLYDRAAQFDLVDKLNNKLSAKFNKLANMEVKEGMLTVLYENIECITSTKLAVRKLKNISKIVRSLEAITANITKMIEKKAARNKAIAEKKAAKAAAKKAAAEALPGAVEIRSESVEVREITNDSPISAIQ